jgi:hypothetical protein
MRGGMRRFLEAFMIPGRDPISLSELRLRTDMQLVALVRREIESSLGLAGRGAIAEAEALWNQASNLLSVASAPDSERMALEACLDEVRAKFSRPDAAARYTHSACC